MTRGAAISFFNLVAAGLVVARAFGAEPDEGVRRTLTGASCGGTGPATLDIVWVMLPNEKALTVAACDWLREEKWRVHFERASAVHSGRRWVRDVQIEAGFGDASVEAIAQALHSVAQATDASDDPPGDASSAALSALATAANAAHPSARLPCREGRCPRG